SGYRGRAVAVMFRTILPVASPRAARESSDNAYEAGGKHVWVIFRRPSGAERGKHERRDTVSAIAFIDDGQGMDTGEPAVHNVCHRDTSKSILAALKLVASNGFRNLQNASGIPPGFRRVARSL